MKGLEEIEHRNILESTIREMLEEHKVILTDGCNTSDVYAIELDPDTTLLADFKSTYPDATLSEIKMANAAFGRRKDSQRIAILISMDLQYFFAFNRQFAEITDNRVLFDTAEQYVLDYVERSGGKTNLPSIVKQKNIRVTGELPGFTQPSLLDRVEKHYEPHAVDMGGQKYFLVDFEYQTSILEDLKRTYVDEMQDDFKLKTADNKFGDDKKLNKYGVLFDEELTMRFAFNMDFARFKQGDGIIYMPVEEAILETKGKPSPITRPRPRRHRGSWRRHGGGCGGAICYAVVGPKE